MTYILTFLRPFNTRRKKTCRSQAPLEDTNSFPKQSFFGRLSLFIISLAIMIILLEGSCISPFIIKNKF